MTHRFEFTIDIVSMEYVSEYVMKILNYTILYVSLLFSLILMNVSVITTMVT